MTQTVSTILYFVMLFLSGGMFPAHFFPETLRNLTLTLPLTHVTNLLQNTFTGQPFMEQGVSIVVLSSIFLGCTFLGIKLFRQRDWT